MAHHTRSQGARCVAACAVLIGTALALQACRDRAPSEPLARRPAVAASLAPPTAPPAPGTQTAVLPSGNGSEGAVGPITLSGDAYAETTLVEVVVSGIISRTRSSSYVVWHDAAGTSWTPLDPGGEYVAGGISDCLGNVTVDFYRPGGSYGGGTGFCDVFNQQALRAEWRATAVVRGTGRASRDGSYIVGNWIACRPTCYVYEGTQQVTVTPIADKLTLMATPAEGLAGRVVHFATGTTDGSPYTVTDWIYVVDDTAQGGLSAAGDSSTACVAPHTSCDGGAEATGTMYVRAVVRGVTEQASARVTVEPDSLVLSPGMVTVKPGETVTFAATTRFGSAFSVVSWAWTIAGNPPIGGVLTTMPPSCGTTISCALAVYESGVVTVVAQVQGLDEPQVATASVTVIPCPPTGDERLDNPAIRKTMFDRLEESRSQNTELASAFFKNPSTGEHLLLAMPQLYQDPCSIEPDESNTPAAPPDFVRDSADFHTHPGTYGSTVTCTPPNAAPYSGTILPGLSEYWSVNADGSVTLSGDWVYEAVRGRAGYLIDGNGVVWRWNHPDDLSFVVPTRWIRESGSICLRSLSGT